LKKISIGICQIKVTDDKKRNLGKAKKMIKEASLEGARIIVLPEMFNCPYQDNFFKKFAETYPAESTNLLSSLAKEFSVYIIGGSVPEKDGSKIYNTSYSFDKKGNLIAKHRKIHLFDIDVEGKIKFKESDTLAPGDKVTVFDTEYCKIGVAICYDIRFPELIRKMVLDGAKIIIVPAAFSMTTGPAHWHIIARTRALDNQVYFLCASPARDLKASYIAYGHSLVADPWGKIIAEATEEEQILYCKIDLDYLEKIRAELPLLKHRREEIYK
jgi:predicted amidohydrolase